MKREYSAQSATHLMNSSRTSGGKAQRSGERAKENRRASVEDAAVG
jgi:hypothetical protein